MTARGADECACCGRRGGHLAINLTLGSMPALEPNNMRPAGLCLCWVVFEQQRSGMCFELCLFGVITHHDRNQKENLDKSSANGK